MANKKFIKLAVAGVAVAAIAVGIGVGVGVSNKKKTETAANVASACRRVLVVPGSEDVADAPSIRRKLSARKLSAADPWTGDAFDSTTTTTSTTASLVETWEKPVNANTAASSKGDSKGSSKGASNLSPSKGPSKGSSNVASNLSPSKSKGGSSVKLDVRCGCVYLLFDRLIHVVF